MKAVQLARLTLAKIDEVMTADQGASYRQNLEKVIPHMADAYRGVDSPFRSHMGASGIGKECGRAIWYGFRWATKPNFDGRMLRLFNRGHLEEARFIAILLAIGCQVYQQDENGKQFRISDAGGHFGGSGDGIAVGIPDLPAGVACLLEFKTHNDKSFIKLAKEGVRAAKFEHFVQMQTYMRKMNLQVALYGAVNKNNDELYMEIITLETEVGDQFVDRAKQLIALREAPKRINESPGWFSCSWCDHKPVCQLNAPPEKNCRTCQYSDCVIEGGWFCRHPNALSMEALTNQEQEQGCGHWERSLGI
jgi:hypothetical protein